MGIKTFFTGLNMNGIDSLFKNSFSLIVSSFFGQIFGFYFWVIAAKYYKPYDIGIVSSILSVILLISMISMMGLPTALIYYLSRNSNKEIINSSLIASTVSLIVLALIFVTNLKVWSPELISIFKNVRIIILFVLIALMTTISSLMTGAFIADRKSHLSMIKDNSFSLMKIPPLILFTGPVGLLTSWSIGLMTAMIIGFIFLYHTWGYIPSIKFNFIIKEMIGFSLGNHVATILYYVPRFIFPIMILNMVSSEFTGYFYIAMTAVGLLYAIPQSLASSFLAETTDNEKLDKNINKAIRFNILLLLPTLVIFIVFGKFFLNIFNHAYAVNAYTTLSILAITSIPLSIINVFNSIRNAQNKVLSTIKINFITTLLSLVIAIPLIKMLGIDGAAISYFIANMIGAVIIIRGIKNPIKYTKQLIKELYYLKEERWNYITRMRKKSL